MIETLTDEQTLRTQAAKDGVTHFVTGIAVFKDDKLLIVRRVEDDFLGGLFEIPGGGVDDGETFIEAAVRETLEETGLAVRRVIGEFGGFDYQTRTKPKVRQLNYIVEVEPGEVVLAPNEHDEYRWITKEDVAALKTSPEMKQCLLAVFDLVA